MRSGGVLGPPYLWLCAKRVPAEETEAQSKILEGSPLVCSELKCEGFHGEHPWGSGIY